MTQRGILWDRGVEWGPWEVRPVPQKMGFDGSVEGKALEEKQKFVSLLLA